MTVVDRPGAAKRAVGAADLRGRPPFAGLVGTGGRRAARASSGVDPPGSRPRPDHAVRGGPRGDLEAGLWLQPSAGFALVGIGRAWSVEPAGPIASPWRRRRGSIAGGRGHRRPPGSPRGSDRPPRRPRFHGPTAGHRDPGARSARPRSSFPTSFARTERSVTYAETPGVPHAAEGAVPISRPWNVAGLPPRPGERGQPGTRGRRGPARRLAARGARRAARSARMGAAGRALRRGRRPRPSRQGRAGAPGRLARRSRSTWRTRCGASPPAHRKGRSTRSSGAGARSSARRRSGSSAPPGAIRDRRDRRLRATRGHGR